MVVITANQRDIIFDAVRAMYAEVAESPQRTFHFPTGQPACQFVGYPGDLLDGLPPEAVESFAGVGCPFAADVLRRGDDVLDVGAGSGTDALIAARLVGPGGTVAGLDMTDAMRAKFRSNIERAGLANVRSLNGNAEDLPLGDATIDVVTSNGVLNLVPDKPRAIAEIFRVLRSGGRVQIADIVLATPPSEACRSHPELWAECIVGATTEETYLDHFRSAGFTAVEILSRLDYFAGSPNPETRQVAASFGAMAVVMCARKEGGAV